MTEPASATNVDPVGAEFEVAIAGAGVTPATVSPRHVADLIDATMSLYEALSGRLGASEVPLAVKAIRRSSCGVSFDVRPDAVPALSAMWEAIRTRGAGMAWEVKQAIRRLFKAGAVGPVRVRVRGLPGHRGTATLYVSEPVEETSSPAVEYTTTIHGDVVGILRGREGYELTLDPLAGGGRMKFRLDDEQVAKASALFDRTVIITASIVQGGNDEGSEGRSALEIEPFEEIDLLGALMQASKESERLGETVDVLALIRELD